ncbi:MAG TPA: hypothetical protein VGS13_14495 [Stellaceae bacterium]|nr:hypothetical protein [Stellaceae bacterium]
MIFTSESGLTDRTRTAEWDEWYRGHLAAMAAVPGVSSAQRFRPLDVGLPPSLAMYTAASPAAGTTWLRTIALDRSMPHRAIAVFPDLAAARTVAQRLGGGAALYTAMTETFVPARTSDGAAP